MIVFARDTFDGSVSDLDGRAFPVGDAEWQVVTGGFLVQDGTCRISSGSPTKSIAVIKNMEPRGVQFVQATFQPSVDNYIGVIARFNSFEWYYLGLFVRPYVHLYSVVAGVSTWLGQVDVSATLSGSRDFAIQTRGDDHVVLWWNGVSVFDVQDFAAPSGSSGLYLTQPGQRIGAFEVQVDGATTTAPWTTLPPSTSLPTTESPTTAPPSTAPGTTTPEPTFPPTTLAPSTAAPTTSPPLTDPPTTIAPSTEPPATFPPTSDGELLRAGFSYVDVEDRLVCRSWITDVNGVTRDSALVPSECRLELIDEFGASLAVTGCQSPSENEARFVIPQARMYREHLYIAKLTLKVEGEDAKGPVLIPMPVN